MHANPWVSGRFTFLVIRATMNRRGLGLLSGARNHNALRVRTRISARRHAKVTLNAFRLTKGIETTPIAAPLWIEQSQNAGLRKSPYGIARKYIQPWVVRCKGRCITGTTELPRGIPVLVVVPFCGPWRLSVKSTLNRYSTVRIHLDSALETMHRNTSAGLVGGRIVRSPTAVPEPRPVCECRRTLCLGAPLKDGLWRQQQRIRRT